MGLAAPQSSDDIGLSAGLPRFIGILSDEHLLLIANFPFEGNRAANVAISVVLLFFWAVVVSRLDGRFFRAAHIPDCRRRPSMQRQFSRTLG
jgi:hypothetical protein